VLLALVGLYLAISVAVGLYAATRVRGAADFAVARGRFGTSVVAATVFATCKFILLTVAIVYILAGLAMRLRKSSYSSAPCSAFASLE